MYNIMTVVCLSVMLVIRTAEYHSTYRECFLIQRRRWNVSEPDAGDTRQRVIQSRQVWQRMTRGALSLAGHDVIQPSCMTWLPKVSIPVRQWFRRRDDVWGPTGRVVPVGGPWRPTTKYRRRAWTASRTGLRPRTRARRWWTRRRPASVRSTRTWRREVSTRQRRIRCSGRAYVPHGRHASDEEL